MRRQDRAAVRSCCMAASRLTPASPSRIAESDRRLRACCRRTPHAPSRETRSASLPVYSCQVRLDLGWVIENTLLSKSQPVDLEGLEPEHAHVAPKVLGTQITHRHAGPGREDVWVRCL